LPIPALNNLFEFLNWIKPIVNSEEYQVSLEALNEFLKPGGDGEKLQNKLIKLSQELDTSWLDPLWNEMYLEYRDQLVSNKNYYSILENAHLKSSGYTVPIFAAKFIYEILNAYVDVGTQSFEPEVVKDRPLCMNQYNHILKSVRLPEYEKDIYITYPFSRHHHIIVYYKNNLYKLITSDSEGNILSVAALASKIQSIIDADIEDRGNDAGALTTATRNSAAKLYKAIAMDSTNQNSLEAINTAVFALCIDPPANSLEDFQRTVLLSDGKNRYFDKNSQIILSEDLNIGINNEHTGADATPWFSIIDRAMRRIAAEENEKIDLVSTSLPEELQWNLSDEIKLGLKDQLNRHQEFADNLYVNNLKFESFGKTVIRKLKMSPDAFFHIALQIAQYKTFGRLRSTYESVSIRSFKNCRTECARPVNEDVKKLAIELCSENFSDDIVRELFINAQNVHVERLTQCQIGLGIERHMFGLYKMFEKYGEELGILKSPSLYDSPGYKLLTHDYFSTSGVAYESIRLFGFGPVVEDGYGIGYVIKDDSLNVSLSTQMKNKDKALELLNHLNNSLLLLMSLMDSKARTS